jgi:hypothetical protein
MIGAGELIAGTVDAGFVFGECYRSEASDRFCIDNRPPVELIPTIKATAESVLMPIRSHFGRAFSPLSFYRSLELERILCRRAIESTREAARVAAVRRPGKTPAGIEAAMAVAEAAYLDRKQHPKGFAVDLRVPRVSSVAVGLWFASAGLEFDQIIFEFVRPDDPAAGWVHISRRPGAGNRREVLTTADGVTYAGGPPAWGRGA